VGDAEIQVQMDSNQTKCLVATPPSQIQGEKGKNNPFWDDQSEIFAEHFDLNPKTNGGCLGERAQT